MKNYVTFEDTEIAFSHLSTNELRKIFLIYSIIQHPLLISLGTKLTLIAIKYKLPVLFFIKHTSFKLFCGGETIEEALQMSRALQKKNVYTCLNYSVEGQDQSHHYDAIFQEILHMIQHQATNTPNKHYCFSAVKISGLIQGDTLRKLQDGWILSKQEKQDVNSLLKNLENLCDTALKCKAKIMLDAEESWIQDAIDQLAIRLMKKYNTHSAVVYTTIQMYRKDKLEYLKTLHKQARKEQYHLGIKLVRGAYLSQERSWAKNNKRPSFVFETKEQTDQTFDEALMFCFNNLERVSLFVGSHNEKSMKRFASLYEDIKESKHRNKAIASQLLGMSDHITFNLAENKIPVCKYIPYGPIKQAIPYLIRRAQENTAVLSSSIKQLKLVKKELRRRLRS